MQIYLMMIPQGPTLPLFVDVVPNVGDLVDLEDLRDSWSQRGELGKQLEPFGTEPLYVAQVIHRMGSESPSITIRVLPLSLRPATKGEPCTDCPRGITDG